jgi:RNA polymerase I-specific transcription initiation factor RRN7
MATPDTEDEAIAETSNLKLDDVPSIIQTVALCYLGIYILRLPVFVGDIIRWIKNKWLPYIGALDMLPPDLRSRLSNVSQTYLRDNTAMSVQRLHTRTNSLFMAYQLGLGIEIPHLNVPLCLYRIIEGLALPLDVYPAARKLAALLQYTFSYPERPVRGWIRVVPDQQLAAFVVVAVKLIYSFDKRVRDPTSTTEPAVAVIDWDVWQKAKKQRNETLDDQDIMTHERAQKMTENEILQMSEAKADQYMDWFTQTWAKPGEARALVTKDVFVQNMFELFPIQDRKVEEIPLDLQKDKIKTSESLNEVHRGLITREVREPDDSEGLDPVMGRPGTQYIRYRKLDELDEVAREFYETVADFVGIPVARLVKLTLRIEKSLAQLNKPEQESDNESD